MIKALYFLAATVVLQVSANTANPSLPEALRSAKAGNAGSQYIVGMMYLFGQGTAPNVPEGVRWIGLSAKAGLPQALVALANLNDVGYGVPLNEERATQLRQQAANAGNPTARQQLERDLKMPGERDFRRADTLDDFKQHEASFAYASKSAEAGSPAGQELLGRAYLYGWGTAKNPAEAVKWFRKSDAGGSAAGSRAMGYVYEFGVGVPVDRKAALMYYDRAVARGSVIAKKVAANLRSPDYDRPAGSGGGRSSTTCGGGMVWDSGMGYCRSSLPYDPPNLPNHN